MRKLCAALLLLFGLADAALAQSIRITTGTGDAVATAEVGTLVWTGTAPTTWTVTLPKAPANGSIVRVTSATTLTTRATVSAASGDTMSASFSSQTLTANTTVVAWQYFAPGAIWYRIQ